MNTEKGFANGIRPTKRKQSFLEDYQKQIYIDGEDLPFGIDPHAPIIIKGVETEEAEGVNEAYVDILEELGKEIVTIFKCFFITLFQV